MGNSYLRVGKYPFSWLMLTTGSIPLNITENVVQFNTVNCSGCVKKWEKKKNCGYQVKRDLYQAIDPQVLTF